MCRDTEAAMRASGMCPNAAALAMRCADLARMVTALEHELMAERASATRFVARRRGLRVLAEMALEHPGEWITSTRFTVEHEARHGRNASWHVFPALRHPAIERSDAATDPRIGELTPDGDWRPARIVDLAAAEDIASVAAD